MATTYGGNGTAKTMTFEQQNAINFKNHDSVKVVDYNGSQYSFMASSMIGLMDENSQPMENIILLGGYRIIDTGSPSFPFLPSIDNNFPIAGAGDPDGRCVVRHLQGLNTIDNGFLWLPELALTVLIYTKEHYAQSLLYRRF